MKPLLDLLALAGYAAVLYSLILLVGVLIVAITWLLGLTLL